MARETRRRRSILAITAATAAALLTTVHGATTGEAEAEAAVERTEAAVERTTVFTRGEASYHTFRIPAVVEAENGTLLAFAEGRLGGSGDWGHNALVLKRSADGGATWGPLQVIVNDGGNWRNPVPVVDRETGRIVLLASRMGASLDGFRDYACQRVPPEDLPHTYVMYSDDSGATWTEPADITDQVSRPDWTGFFTGPGHGIQLTQGEHAGRLVVAGRHTVKPDPESGEECSGPNDQGNHALYSDDGGTTWQIGAVDEQGDPDVRPNESTVVELADGSLYFNSRDQADSHGRRLDTTSNDGGETFDEPYAAMQDVVTSRIHGGLTRLPATADRPDRVVFSITDHPTSRENLTLSSSFDGGQTWEESFVVHDGPAGYSDMVVLADRPGDREIGVLFESGARFYPGDPGPPNHHDITFARVPERLLDTPTPPASVSPDAAGDHDGLISGSPELTAGQFGRATALLGDTVDLPLTDATAFGSGPFTAAAWFRTDYGLDQALMYAHGRRGPRWFLQVQPNRDRIRAQVRTDDGVRNMDIPWDYADGQWHHVALTRGPDGLALYFDGSLIDTSVALDGSVSDGARFGIRIGARLDVLGHPMNGSVDEVRLFDTALTADQVADLATINTANGAEPVTHLPMDQIIPKP